MCGIFGAQTLNGRFKKEQFNQFVSLTNIVQYRGPDAAGYRAFRIKHTVDALPIDESFDIFLGHRRLSIIDLSQESNQPLTNDGKIWIIFNGEIFNYLELRADLAKKGYESKTQSDTEVILNTYKEYGEAGFARFNGMWAFVILDLEKKKLILSRDRFSIKPLYYYSSPSGFFFASEIKQLLPLLNKKEMQKDILYAYLKQGLVDHTNETFFNGIYKIKPRHSLTLNLETGAVKETEYWNFHKEATPKLEQEAVEQFRYLLTDAVRIRLRSDVPIGIMLSGGLDSSSIALISSKNANQEIQSFSSVSNDALYSEEKFIDILARSLKLSSTKFASDPNKSWDMIDRALWHNEEPFTNFIPVVHYEMMSKIKKQGKITVLLNGQGGDEILCGYKKFFFFYLWELLRKKQFTALFGNVFFSLINQTILWQFSLKESKRYMPFLSTVADPIDDCLLWKGHLEPLRRISSLRERQIKDIERYSVPYLTHYEDRGGMAHGLEIRLPFLDHRLVNFALNIPDSLKIRNGWTKYILRKAMKDLPTAIAWRKDKQGFLNPETKWFQRDFQKQIMEIFTQSSLGELGVVRADKLVAMYKKYLQGDARIWHADIVRFFIAELWIKKFILASP